MSNENILALLHRAGQIADELFAERVGEVGITPRQFAVLKAVAGNEEPSQTTLVYLTGIDRSTLADIVRRLVERDLLKCRRTRRDARMYAVGLTEKGEAILKAASPAATAVDEHIKSLLGDKVYDTLVEALGIITTPDEDPAAQKKAG